MTYILSIETSTKNCSVSLSLNGETISTREAFEDGYSHAEKLHVFIEEVLKESEIEFSKLNAVAVSQGPGSYTGLRIGVSAAKGICYALSIPLIALDTLEILARELSVNDDVVVPMIDARRMECYTAIFSSDFNLIREVKSEIINEESFSEIENKIHFLGDGASKCKEVLKGDKFVYHDEYVFPSSKQMGNLAFEKYKKSDTVNVAYFEPFYLKDFMITTSPK